MANYENSCHCHPRGFGSGPLFVRRRNNPKVAHQFRGPVMTFNTLPRSQVPTTAVTATFHLPPPPPALFLVRFPLNDRAIDSDRTINTATGRPPRVNMGAGHNGRMAAV